MRTTIQKIDGMWMAGYFGEDGINHFIEDGKTKDDLIHKLSERVVNSKNST